MALADSLVSYWKLDESSGNAADSVGSNTLTNVNTTPFGAAKINNGADHESGSSQYFDLGATITTSLTDISFGGWFKPESIGAEMTLICNGYGGGSGRGYMMQIDSAGKPRIDISFVAAITATTVLSAGTFYHLFVTRGASTWNIYVNASSENTGTNNPFGIEGEARTAIGARRTDGASWDVFYDGFSDEIGWWNRELSGAEISELYNGGAGLAYPFTGDEVFNLTLLGVG